jgi:hypothetical protein
MAIEVVDSDITLEGLLSIEDFDKDTKSRIQKSEILLLPFSVFGDKNERAFYPETSDFLKFAKTELDDYKIDICENKGKEKTEILQSADVWLPILLISIDPLKDVILPIIVSLISNYLFYKSKKETKDDEGSVNVQIIIHDKKRNISKNLKYDGPVSGLDQLNAIDVNKIFEGK